MTEDLVNTLNDFCTMNKNRQERGELPVMPGHLPNPFMTTLIHERDLKEAAIANKVHAIRWRTTLMAPITHGVAPEELHGLQSICIEEAICEVNKIHKNRIMFLTTVKEAYRDLRIQLLVEDVNGHRLLLQLYNYLSFDEDPAQVFPPGTYLAMLEPYLRFPRDIPENPACMRCDNPQAIRIFSNKQQWLNAQHGVFGVINLSEPGMDIAQLFTAAKNAYLSNDFEKAIHFYTCVLNADPCNSKSLSNRAQCQLRMERWGAALADCIAALELNDQDFFEKCIYRKALALLMLQRPAEADVVIGQLTSEETKEIKQLRIDISRAMREKKGDYDIKAMILEAKPTSTSQQVSLLSRRHMDYESPDIEIVQSGGEKGRCVIARTKLQAGTLLMVSKAFACEVCSSSDLVFAFDSNRPGLDSSDKACILPRVVRELLSHPERSHELYSLSGGHRFDNEPLPAYTGAVEIKRIASILHNNWFSLQCDDIEASRCIKSHRWMEYSGALIDPSCRDAEHKKFLESYADVKSMEGTGLWVRPSLFNHSCSPNCTYFNISDFMLVSTNRDVEASEECCVSYLDPFESYDKRAENLAQWNQGQGFVCECPRCSASRNRPDVVKLEKDLIEAFELACTLSASRGLKEAADGAISPKKRKAMRKTPDALPPILSCGALCRLLEIEAGSLASINRGDEAVALYQKMIELRHSVVGSQGNLHYIRDNIRLSYAAVLAKKFDLAQHSMLESFRAACLVDWKPRLTMSKFLLLVKNYNIGNSLDSVTKCLRLAETANENTGGKVSQAQDIFCVYCISEINGKVLRCSQCQVPYCTKEHQKKHWKLHKHVCVRK